MKIDNRYAEMRAAARVREPALFVSPRIPSELELQARWFGGDFGRNFVSTTGDKIDIVQFGTEPRSRSGFSRRRHQDQRQRTHPRLHRNRSG